ncbi:TIGR04438 family Trp-rich protein [Sapientia aquatica]|uniref:TIGR04438 family Trp-rich protein n=1 Tax=Sapientia aquatica TaxID=1549640 RepID=A0A4R5W4I2_9BURK|nr:TIGR04438 family Trp-rich protein [Sapientia aquatica]TDK67997.1 TIGR04438 family Trp-rich protein [Sapientia aquatica]
MYLILLTVVLAGLKYFEVSFMDDVSWWWVIACFFVTFIWFEFIERMLGLDKKKAHKKFDEVQKNRAKRMFEKKK